MKRFTFRLASAALGLSLCFGATASASIPVSLAPAQSNLTKPNDIIIVTGPHYVVVVTRAAAQHMLEHVDQSAQFDGTN